MNGNVARGSSAVNAANAVTEPPMILLLEDDEAVARVVTQILARQHWRVLVTHDLPNALEVVEHYEGRIDLLLLDLHVPGGSVVPSVPLLRRHRPEARVLLTSGYPEAIASNLPWPLLAKPFSPEELVLAIRREVSATGPG
jgi:DNA-binding response OmpR family regulator